MQKNAPNFSIFITQRLWKFRSPYPDMFLVVCLTINHDTWQEIRLKDTRTSLSGLILVSRSHKWRNGGYFEHNLKRQAILKICHFFILNILELNIASFSPFWSLLICLKTSMHSFCLIRIDINIIIIPPHSSWLPLRVVYVLVYIRWQHTDT